MRVVAMVDLEAAGFKFVAPVGVQIKGRSVEEVGADLAAIPQIVTISAVVGVQDIELQIVARDMDELNLILTKRIPSIGGIARITPALAMNVLKYESPWVPFT
jgi:Lrp/AsnC family transcriptional regulator for asnA, asnC and gidA